MATKVTGATLAVLLSGALVYLHEVPVLVWALIAVSLLDVLLHLHDEGRLLATTAKSVAALLLPVAVGVLGGRYVNTTAAIDAALTVMVAAQLTTVIPLLAADVKKYAALLTREFPAEAPAIRAAAGDLEGVVTGMDVKSLEALIARELAKLQASPPSGAPEANQVGAGN